MANIKKNRSELKRRHNVSLSANDIKEIKKAVGSPRNFSLTKAIREMAARLNHVETLEKLSEASK